MSDQTNSGAGGASGAAELPGAVLGTATAAPPTAPMVDPDVLVGLAGQAGIALSRERAAALAAPLAAVVDGVRRAMPARRDQIAPALVFRAPREV
jgi:hypothetical protein